MIEIYKDVINNYQFNEESELVINQLKQYMPYEAQIQESNEDGNVKKKLPKRPSFARCAYRKLPLSFRKKVKGYMLESDSEIIKELNILKERIEIISGIMYAIWVMQLRM